MPGRSGLFGTWVAASDLYMRIGLEQDTNLTHSRRALLLLESQSMRGWDGHRVLLSRVMGRYRDDVRPGEPPRFLLNDVLRYWRTITVDYQAKKLHSGEWGLRYVKMAISRKLLVAGLIGLVLTEEADAMTDALQEPALARLARLHARLETDAAREAVIEALRCAETFAVLLADEGFRDRMRALPSRIEAENDSAFQEARSIAVRVHDSLMTIFLDDPLLTDRTRKYLLF